MIYSINMLIYTSGNIDHESPDQNLQNCYIESFLTHVRNLYFFFYEEKKQKDDIILKDFTDKLLSRNSSDSLIKRINKTLSHLTYSEIDKRRVWEIGEITNEFFPICLDFLEEPAIEKFELDENSKNIKLEIIKILKNKIHNG
ncbi:MAG: hypothetical protein WC069_06835 [Candidatus Shapirobacteria bacterium]